MEEVWGTEVTLYYLACMQGATDVAGIYDGRESIIDFKQTNKPKDVSGLKIILYSWLHMQWPTIMYDTHIQQGVILMRSKDETCV